MSCDTIHEAGLGSWEAARTSLAEGRGAEKTQISFTAGYRKDLALSFLRYQVYCPTPLTTEAPPAVICQGFWLNCTVALSFPLQKKALGLGWSGTVSRPSTEWFTEHKNMQHTQTHAYKDGLCIYSVQVNVAVVPVAMVDRVPRWPRRRAVQTVVCTGDTECVGEALSDEDDTARLLTSRWSSSTFFCSSARMPRSSLLFWWIGTCGLILGFHLT